MSSIQSSVWEKNSMSDSFWVAVTIMGSFAVGVLIGVLLNG